MRKTLQPFFNQYETLVEMTDSTFSRVKKEHSDCVTCKIECADCCHALFDLTLIEALYLNHHFNRIFSGPEKDTLLEIANRADRSVYQIKRRALQALERGAAEADVLTQVAEERIRCPLLDEKNRCGLYAFRPITCRLYGIPTSIQGTGHTCGKSGFVKGSAYPTVNLDVIHRKLFDISAALVKALGSRHIKMADMLLPVSMALLTVFDEDYLGLSPIETPETDGNSRKKGGNNDPAQSG
ncbi:MAG: YkgJ family cysteine cluster protein [Desulfobacterales bacterium]|nr:YkgJ family cysteine cluster protein [Desulfobacterales bacterium]